MSIVGELSADALIMDISRCAPACKRPAPCPRRLCTYHAAIYCREALCSCLCTAPSILTTHGATLGAAQLKLELPVRSLSARGSSPAHPRPAIGSHYCALQYAAAVQPCSRCPATCSSKLPSLTARVSILRTTRPSQDAHTSPLPSGPWGAPVSPLDRPASLLRLALQPVRRGMATAR
jgi:hypothetical protein